MMLNSHYTMMSERIIIKKCYENQQQMFGVVKREWIGDEEPSNRIIKKIECHET